MQTFERVQRADGLVVIDGVEHAVVPDIDRMAPFLMSVVSEGDRWMFVSSSGGLTAGRRDASQSLFPYVTDDRLHAAGGATGPVTVLHVRGRGDEQAVWEPFAPVRTPDTQRSLAKTVTSDSVVFTERHERLGLTFSYRWSTAEELGFVRRATLTNDGPEPRAVDVVDGLVDVLPYGLDVDVLSRFSNLANAYRRSEVVDRGTGLTAYTIESPVSDRPEPEEVLRATAVWSFGLDGELTLDPAAVATARVGGTVPPIHLLTGVPGAHLRRATVELAAGDSVTWYIVADVALDQVALTELARTARGTDTAAVEAATRATGQRIAAIMAPADAFQRTGDEIACAHHLSDTIFNVMRGGVPLDGYRIDTADFVDLVAGHDRRVVTRHGDWLADLPPVLDRRELFARVDALGDADLRRLADGYLPFSFSRRHGDPSRPWNQFSIRVTGPDGEPVRYYEGNWRDVFQNWEALCTSFPEYLPGVVSVLVNASTPDGHNPYRITREGIDWEVPDPDDPWANIGYWGDHQVVYLLRLLLAADQYLPGEIVCRLGEPTCTYADVPYRIAPYDELVHDPKATITFDVEAERRTAARVSDVGADGKLVHGQDGELVRVTLMEKLLVTALAKLSNLVPGGGIWMNTQRPEWNDANNALVGNGLSMVTLYHLRSYLDHVRTLVAEGESFTVTDEVGRWLDAVRDALAEDPAAAVSSDVERRRLMDRLGAAGSVHRNRVYQGFSGATTAVPSVAIVELCERALAHLDASIADNRRADGLMHSYNLLRLSSDAREAAVERLPVMLEGQVAALTPGVLSALDQADLLDALFASELFRSDQQTFTLAPTRRPPRFLDKNVIDPAAVDDEPLFVRLVADGDRTLVQTDADGRVRFAPDVTSSAALELVLDRVARDPAYAGLVAERRGPVRALYEQVFGHHAHLGRSGLMYAYEGIGSVYWHMVTKLLLAVQEALTDAIDRDVDAATVDRLVDAYWRVSAGLGFNKSAAEFGAVPIDPYSHTPSHAGAQQPGMTGAVKEEILARRRELGVRVRDGRIEFDSVLVRDGELLEAAADWRVTSVLGDVDVELPTGSLGLTVCQVPVVVSRTDGDPAVEIEFADGHTERFPGGRVSVEVSADVFSRAGRVAVIRAGVT